MQDVFAGMGVPLQDAKIASEVLITSDLRGVESHGIGRLKYYYDRIKSGQHLPVTNFEVVRESRPPRRGWASRGRHGDRHTFDANGHR